MVNMRRVKLSRRGDFLVAKVGVGDLGFRPARIWCSCPGIDHRTTPYWLPRTVRIGVRESREAGASIAMEGSGSGPRALAYSTQGLYERWLGRLEQAGVTRT